MITGIIFGQVSVATGVCWHVTSFSSLNYLRYFSEAVFLIILLVVSVVVLARMRDLVGESKKSGRFFQSPQISSRFYRPARKA
jgi:hypothetical protein